MPLLRSITLKIKTKFTPPSSPTTASPTTGFQVVGREERSERKRAETNISMESFMSDDGVSVPARVLFESLEKVKAGRKGKRRSKFREELGEGN